MKCAFKRHSKEKVFKAQLPGPARPGSCGRALCSHASSSCITDEEVADCLHVERACMRACARVHPSVRPRPSSCELRVCLGQLWSFLLSECVCCVCAVWFSWYNSSALPSCSCAICGFCGDDSSHSSLGDRCRLLLSYLPSWRFVSFVNLSGSLHSRNCASLKFFEQSSLDMEHLSKLTV